MQMIWIFAIVMDIENCSSSGERATTMEGTGRIGTAKHTDLPPSP